MEYMGRIITGPAKQAQARLAATASAGSNTVAAALCRRIPLPSLDVLAPRGGPSTVEFRNVSFKYKNNDVSRKPKTGVQQQQSTQSENSSSGGYLLKNISFKIEKGQSVAIVGPSGSGKWP